MPSLPSAAPNMSCAISAVTPTAWPSATTPHRLRRQERVSFRWRDYAHGGKQRVMPLDAAEFLRRFFLHVLPRGFVRIRHYGLLSNRFRKQLLPLARTLLAAQAREPLPLPPLPSRASLALPTLQNAPMRVVQRFTAAQLYSQASIPHDRLRQSALPALAPRMPSQQCVHRIRRSFKTTFTMHIR